MAMKLNFKVLGSQTESIEDLDPNIKIGKSAPKGEFFDESIKSNSIYSLKELIGSYLDGIPASLLILKKDGNNLENEKTLAECGLVNDDTINIEINKDLKALNALKTIDRNRLIAYTTPNLGQMDVNTSSPIKIVWAERSIIDNSFSSILKKSIEELFSFKLGQINFLSNGSFISLGEAKLEDGASDAIINFINQTKLYIWDTDQNKCIKDIKPGFDKMFNIICPPQDFKPDTNYEIILWHPDELINSFFDMAAKISFKTCSESAEEDGFMVEI